MTVRDCGSVVDSRCAPARLLEVCLTEPAGRFPDHRNKTDGSRPRHPRLNPIPRLIGAGVATDPGLPVRPDNPIRNT
jgi:hypothetical protein